ncbi:MAG: hypothetical protein JXR94_20805 [Candidatus Hydrogenedentes bacterium]|nr:hypothetical protein [Candidatus Hydrogenedentota bacterium]
MIVTSLACALTAALAAAMPGAAYARFDSAKPIWPEGRDTEMNLSVGFRAVVAPPEDGRPVLLRVTASTIYRAFVNGRFVGHGPARAGHGYFRVDEWDITGAFASGPAVVAIEVSGYNANSYALIDQPSFLQAEVVADGRVLASTAGDGAPFEALILTERVQKAIRFSFQRLFSEVYELAPSHGQWRVDPAAAVAAVPCATLAPKKLLARGVPYPRFELRPVLRHVSSGTVEPGAHPDRNWRPRFVSGIGPELKGFPEAELAAVPTNDLIRVQSSEPTPVDAPVPPDARFDLGTNSYHILDFGTNLTGFMGATITCHEPCRVMFVFDEILSGNDVNFARITCAAVVAFGTPSALIPPGTYAVESCEPNTLRYLKLINLEGACSIDNVYLRDYVNPDVWEAQFACSDPRLNRLFAAGRETFAQNAVDVFMDCPSRERAGWLCDSLFTSRAGFALSGDTCVERNFFENYLLPEQFEHLPDGMLPMCYPSDHYDGNFIPNWALWFVIQLQEYVERSGDWDTVRALEPKVRELFEYFEGFRNADGLLQDLEAWVFIEWSAANRFVQNVNYPSNMLYAGALDAAATLYGRDDLRAQARHVRETVLSQSFDGEFFVDNAEVKDGKLEITRNRTEVCQYFAFFFGLASPETHPALWARLRDEFGPDREDSGAYKDIHAANSFVGNMLRFELLSRYGEADQILDESIDYLLYMAERTGTLWENVDERASCNHGFASHICHTLYRDVLGLYRVDPVQKRILLRFCEVPLDWCEGRHPLPDGAVSLRWWKAPATDGTVQLHYRLDAPAGYAVEVESVGDTPLVREP